MRDVIARGGRCGEDMPEGEELVDDADAEAGRYREDVEVIPGDRRGQRREGGDVKGTHAEGVIVVEAPITRSNRGGLHGTRPRKGSV